MKVLSGLGNMHVDLQDHRYVKKASVTVLSHRQLQNAYT